MSNCNIKTQEDPSSWSYGCQNGYTPMHNTPPKNCPYCLKPMGTDKKEWAGIFNSRKNNQ